MPSNVKVPDADSRLSRQNAATIRPEDLLYQKPTIFEGVEQGRSSRIRPTRPQFWGLAIAFWCAEFALAELRSVVDHSPKLGIYSLLRITTALIGCAECLGLHWLAKTMRHRSRALQIALFLASSALAGVVNLDIGDAIQSLTRFKVADYGLGWRVYNHTYWVLMLLAWASIYLALRFSGEASDQERHSRLLERFAHEAQLRALRFQVDPHFLFNTLNSVSALVRADRGDAAEAMIRRMSDFFRSTLEASPDTDIPLAGEVALQQTYLEIERVRFPNLTIEVALPPETRDYMVPTLILQPLVENAVKYAVSSCERPARVRIGARFVRNGALEVSVTDNGAGAAGPPGTGTGLSNVRERIRARYGHAATLGSGPCQPAGWEAVITLPRQTAGGPA